MAFYLDKAAKSWVVQLQRTLPDGTKLRKCKRLRGTRDQAKTLDQEIAAALDREVEQHRRENRHNQERLQAAKTLGIELTGPEAKPSAGPPTLRDYLTGRWARHAAVVQNTTTRRTTRTHVAYIALYLGDLPLDRVDAGAVARLREGLLLEGPRCFTLNRSGEPRKPRVSVFRPMAINRIMGTLAAVLALAKREGVISHAPEVDLLPPDDSQSIVPPTDEELGTILKAATNFVDVAPFMAEAIEIAAETGLRAGEQFTLPWRSVDFSMGETGAIRVEKQLKVKMIDGRPWAPKHHKFRIVPLTPRARAILLDLRERVPSAPDDPVIPSRGGSPYNRLEAAPGKAGKGFFSDVVVAAGIEGRVRWHDLRHYFAVRALLRSVPITVVSSWLGHSDINLTVKRYGRWTAEAREQWQWAKKMGEASDSA